MAGRERDDMVKTFEDLQQVSKDNVDVTLKAFGVLSKGTQAIAVEVATIRRRRSRKERPRSRSCSA